MEFEPKTKGGFKYEIWKEINGYLIGVVHNVNEMPGDTRLTKWTTIGSDININSKYNLIPKKRRIWVLEDNIKEKNTGRINYINPNDPEYIEFVQANPEV